MKKIVSPRIKLSVVNFALAESSNLEKLRQETPDFAASPVRKHLEIKKTLFVFLTLWNLPN